jgi:putative membrane protein
MTTKQEKRRSPAALKADDPKVVLDELEIFEKPVAAPPTGEADQSPPAPDLKRIRRGVRWGGILISALGGLLLLALGTWMTDYVVASIQRQDWLGWLTLGLLGIAVFAATMIILREVVALLRIRRLDQFQHTAQSALNQDDNAEATKLARQVTRLYAPRAELAWGQARLADHDGDILDARERLVLVERELVSRLDTDAKAAIASSARRVSVITAASPSSLADMFAVTFLNFRMLRQVATVYGARPGMIGLFKLAGMVISHIAITGGIAIGDDLVQQMIGQRLTAKLSARLGEGIFNGALTARIGLAAIDVCRPLPLIEAKRPRLRDLVKLVFR